MQINDDITATDPYASLYDSGSVAPHEGETITTQLAGRPVMNGMSFTAPAFVAKSTLCNLNGEKANFGSEQYTTTLEGTRGEGPLLCVHNNFNKLDRELEQHVNGMRRMIREFVMADHRYNLLVHSGFKYVASTGLSFNQRLTGGEYLVDQNFEGDMPDAAITWRELVRIAKEVRTRAQMTMWGNGSGSFVKFIGSAELIERLRNEQNNHAEITSLVEGSDRETTNAFKAFSWEMPYRGISMAEDEKPLRFNSVNGSGFPVLLTPYEVKVGNSGEHWVTNDEWINGDSEVAFLAFRNGFRKLTPQQLTNGGGGANWRAQDAVGSLEWLNERDMTCNKYGDAGQFIWQIIRGYQPMNPWTIIPILTKRCAIASDLVRCDDSVSEV